VAQERARQSELSAKIAHLEKRLSEVR